MMNEKKEVNSSIGCNVTECKYNNQGDFCTLRKIHVGGAAYCTDKNCTCCDSYEKR
jgi:hypothetical protein